jgi:hypothetical protein
LAVSLFLQFRRGEEKRHRRTVRFQEETREGKRRGKARGGKGRGEEGEERKGGGDRRGGNGGSVTTGTRQRG